MDTFAFLWWSLRIASVRTLAMETDRKCGGAYPLMAKARSRGPHLEAVRAGHQDQPGCSLEGNCF